MTSSESIDFEARYMRSSNIVSRRIAGEAVLVPIQKKAEDVSAIYNLNDTASVVWEAFDGQRTVRAVCDLIVAEFEVEAEEACRDVAELVQQLASAGLLVKV